ncbi:ParB/RepB/Spo0J family partition protein [Deinococcus sp. 23YEL01]|uniref:ParB/RepB/Spo0J family partition protein n=1 Tax=Deinococcus sp. 23YEL01 TaxID=2745871 RepID=UPI001E5A69DC|nr:ParB/RepB/Spo0J family partition protein [Deinococcus sp. 23YEL01]
MNAFGRKGPRLTNLLERAQSFTAQDGAGAAPAAPQTLPLDLIVPNPRQPRRHFDPQQLQDLAVSIAERGVLQPIMVRPSGERFEIVFGERRYRASRLAGRREIPVIVQAVSDEEFEVIATLENLQRADLNRFEEVTGKLTLLARTLSLDVQDVPAHLKQMRANPQAHPEDVQVTEQLFAQLGGEQWVSFVVNGLPVLSLKEPMRAAVERGELAYSKALLIARAPDALHAELVAGAVAQGWSQAEVRAQIRARQSHGPATSGPATSGDTLRELRRQLSPARLAALPEKQRARAERLMAELGQLLS